MPCRRSREHKAMGEPGRSWDTQILHGNKGSSPLLSLCLRGQSKQLLTDIVRGTTRALRLFATPMILKTWTVFGGTPEHPLKPFEGTPKHLVKLLRGTPSPAGCTSKGTGTSHPATSSPFGIKIQGNSLDSKVTQELRSSGGNQPLPAPCQPFPARNGTEAPWKPHPALLPGRSKELQQLFCSGESSGSFYNQSATPSRLFFSFKGSS